MAAATVDSETTTTTIDAGSLKPDSISIVDLRLLSQSELYSLSLCSSSGFDTRRCDDVVIPKIDRSVFNESAGSRKQTYSRLRLAPPSSSSSATPRRRTPHLRSTATTFANSDNHNSDPENAENANIVTLLKQLFVTDMNPGDLVPVKIDYSHSLLPQQLLSMAPSSPSNVGTTGQKRKRGRPRRNELLGNESELAVGVSVVDVNVVADGFSSLNEIVVRENVEDRDREVLNRDGVAVDLVALGAVEHPYWEEIKRRTEGMRTEEELLRFLKGLNGQWGSRRKKKRIVDASEFGTALPVGWKLSLMVKKKNGHVWLYCRRYISPSGLHFVSCKGVSSYLLSLHGVQNTNSHAWHNEIVKDADKLTSIKISDLVIEDNDRKESLVSHIASPTFGSTSGNHEMQVMNAADLPEDGVGEILHRNKCSITFSEKDELLQHQSSGHRRNRSKNGKRITDGVIIKDGKYECQFCHKTFSERHRYNGHIGAHVRYQAKIAGEAPAGGLGESVDPSSHVEYSVRDTMPKGSLGSDNVVEICNSVTNNGLNFFSPCNKDNEHVGDLKEANRDIRGVDEATDIVTAAIPCSVSEVLFSSNENKSFHEDARANGCAAEIINDGSGLQGKSGNCSPLPSDDTTHGDTNDVIENSASIEKPEQNMASESSLFDSNNHLEACDDVLNNEHICRTRNELKLDSENFAMNASIFDFFGNHGGQDKDLAVSVKQISSFEYLPCKIIGATAHTSTSTSVASKLNKEFNISMLPTSHDEKAFADDHVNCSIDEHKVDETCRFGTGEKGSSKTDNDAASRRKQIQFGISSVISSWNEQESVSIKYDTEAFTCLLKNPGVQNTSESRLVASSGHESICGVENNDEVCRRMMEMPEFDGFQNFGNGEQSDPFGSSDTALNSNSMTGNDRKFGACSAISSATDKQFFTENNVIRVFNGALEEHKKEPSGIAEVSDEAYTLNKIYATPSNQYKLNEIGNSGKHELSLSFGNLQTELCTDSNRVEQERYPAESFNIQSVVHKTYGDQPHLGMINSSIPAELKQGSTFGIDIPDSSFNNRTHDLGSSFNMALPRRDWTGPRGDNMGTSGHNFMAGFGNSSSQSGECVTADGSWRKGHENVFQGSFDATSSPQVQSSKGLRTFGITSDKGEEGSFGVNMNYDIQTDMLRPSGTEPVEYSFMGEQSSNSPPEKSKMFSYNVNTEQGLDPSFWLVKDASTPKTVHGSQVTSVCVWCRNVFFHDPIPPGTQTGAIGSMCPSCSSRIPCQFNVL